MLASHSRFVRLCFPSVAIAVLTGCGGGSAQSALPLSQPALKDAATPWPGGGASLVYSGTLKQTGTGSPGSTLDVTQRVGTTQATYAGRSVTDYHGIETESGKGASLKTTFDAYVAEVPSTIRIGSDVELLKTASSASNGIRETTIYRAGSGLFDQVPEVPQARWNDTAERTQSVSDAVASSSVIDTYYADGSYDESAVPVEGRQASAQSYGDGNAVYQWPLAEASMNSTIAFSPPSGGFITVLFTNASQHVVVSMDVGVWYPTLSPVLAGDSFQDLGKAGIPSACNVPKHYGTTATELIERATRLDVVFGEYESTQRTAYVEAPYGLLCLDVHDDLQTYYDYETVTLSAKPLTETVADEILGLQEAHISKKSAVTATSVALPLDARIDVWRAAQRLKTARAIFYSLRHVRKTR